MPCIRKIVCITLLLMISILRTSPVFASETSLPRTGQATIYDSGDDGAMKSGLPYPAPRFTDSSNGTVRDNLTGLTWLKDADCFASQIWASAISSANGLANGSCLLSDGSTAGQWRLPSVNELESLVDAASGTPALPAGHPFSGAQSLDYWSSSTYAGDVSFAWNVHMGSGQMDYQLKSDLLKIWPVRAGASASAPVARTGQTATYAAGDDGDLLSGVAWPVPRFTDNSNGTVTDSLTGLIWLKNADCFATPTWANAISSANGLASGSCNLSDSSTTGQWRLSNRKELLSLIDRSKFNLALPSGHPFSGVLTNDYWSSGTSSLAPDDAWLVSLSSGGTSNDVKTGGHYLWPVRGGQFGDSVISVSPGTVDFGSVSVGGNSGQSVTINNTAAAGSSSLQINAVTLRGADPDHFSINPGDGSGGSCGVTPIIAPGGSCSVIVSFSPALPAAKSAILRISGSDVTAANSDIPLVGVGLGFTVSGSVSGGNGSIASSNPVGGASGAVASFTLAPEATYQPATAVTGTCPAGSWDMNTYTTGAINADCTAGFSFVKIIYLFELGFTGTGSGTVAFSTGSSCSSAGGSCNRTFDAGTSVTLTPAADAGAVFQAWSGDCSGTGPCSVTMNSAKNVTTTFTVNAIAASPAVYDFGEQPVGSSTSQTITLTSNRGGPLTVTGITPVGDGAAAYGVTPGSCGSLTPTIAAGSSCTMNVVFNPVSPQIWDGSIIITSNDPAAPTTYFPVSGKGVGELFDLGLIFSGYGSGSVAFSTGTVCTGHCSNSFVGGVVQLTPTPGNSSAFNSWTGCDSQNGNICTVILNGSRTVTAGFRSLLVVPLTPPPQTGRTSCHDASGAARVCDDTGEDGDLVPGVKWPSVRFIASPNQTAIDSLTGLIWSRDAAPVVSSKSWLEALNYIKTLNSQNYLGQSDWRLPNAVELRSLINWQEANPANWLAGQGFTNLQTEYWSSTSYAASLMGVSHAWSARMEDGVVWHQPKSSTYHIWPVRGGQTGTLGTLSLIATGQYLCYGSGNTSQNCSGTGEDGEYRMGTDWVSPMYIQNDDQTVTDATSGIVWNKDGGLGANTWQGALDYINSLNNGNYLGHSDWRLPSIFELASMFYQPVRLLGEGYNDWGFSNVQDAFYWSSSSYAENPSRAWIIDFYQGGNLIAGYKSGTAYIWPVRGGYFELSVTPAAIAFPGTTAVFSSPSRQELTIRNQGSINQAVGTISMGGPDAGQFSVTTGTCTSLAPTVAAGMSCTVSVTFTPTTAGSKSATLLITSGDPAALTSSVSLTGNAVIDPSPYGSVSINNGATYASNAAVSLNLYATGSVTDMRFSNNNSTWSGWESYSTSKSWDLMASGGDGQKTVYVQFRDSAENVSSSFADTILLDTTPPVVTLTAKPSPWYNSANGSVHFTSSDPATFTCSINGGIAVSCSSPWNFTGLADDSHTLAIIATNAAGLTADSVVHSWTVDTASPETAITGQPDNPATSSPYTFNLNASEPGSTFEYKINAGTFNAFLIPYTLTNLCNGSHTLQVRAKDPAGNYDSTAADFTWTVANPGVVMTNSSCFDSLAAALAASVNGDFLRMQAAMPPASLNFSGSGTRILLGGYDVNFSSQSGSSRLLSLIIAAGTLIIDRIEIW